MPQSFMKFENHRQVRIVQYLLDSAIPITGSQLALYLHVSPRLIRYDMQYLKQILKHHDVQLTSIRGKGYCLHDKKKASAVMRPLMETNHFLYDQIGVVDTFLREQLILRTLLLEDGIIKFQSLMDQFYISRSTLLKDLEHIQNTIAAYDLTLHQIPYRGVQLEGSELHKRMMLARESAFFKDHDLLTFIHQEKNIPDIPLDQLADLIEYTFQYKTSHIWLFNLYVHVSIMLLRIYHSHLICIDDLQLDSTFTSQQIVICKDFLVQRLPDLEIPEPELSYFLLLLKVCCDQISLPVHKMQFYNRIAQELLDELTEETHIIFERPALDTQLSAYLYPQQLKIHNDITSNPLLVREIKKFSPLCVELSYRCAKKIEEKLSIHIHEKGICNLAYLFYNTLPREQFQPHWHILVIGARSRELEMFFMSQIKCLFCKATLDHVDAYRSHSMRLSTYDMIISSANTQIKEEHASCIQVKYFLQEEDVTKIMNAKKGLEYQKYQKVIQTILTLDVTSYQQLFHWYCQNYLPASSTIEIQDFMDHEERITYDARKKIVIICVFQPKHIKSILIQLKNEIHWRTTSIQFVAFVNINYKKSLTYQEWEYLSIHFDELIAFVKKKS